MPRVFFFFYNRQQVVPSTGLRNYQVAFRNLPLHWASWCMAAVWLFPALMAKSKKTSIYQRLKLTPVYLLRLPFIDYEPCRQSALHTVS